MDPLDWFPVWLRGHLARFPNHKLPDPSTPGGMIYFDGWRDQFALKRVRRDQAEAASRMLMAKKCYASDHFVELFRLINEARYGGQQAEVEQAGAHCRECGGEGLVSVPCNIAGLQRDRDVRGSFAVFCVCSLGRWKLGKAQREAKANQRVLDLAAIRNGEVYQAVILGRNVSLEFDEGDWTNRNRGREFDDQRVHA